MGRLVGRRLVSHWSRLSFWRRVGRMADGAMDLASSRFVRKIASGARTQGELSRAGFALENHNTASKKCYFARIDPRECSAYLI